MLHSGIYPENQPELLKQNTPFEGKVFRKSCSFLNYPSKRTVATFARHKLDESSGMLFSPERVLDNWNRLSQGQRV
jgi:hypothetical protein